MTGLESVIDGVATLENGVLECDRVIADDIQTNSLNTINLSVLNIITAGESIAIGRDEAVGNSIVSPNLYTTKLLSNTMECNKVKTKIFICIIIYNHMMIQMWDIKESAIIASSSLLFTNISKSIVSLPLPIGVYTISYCFTLGLSGV